MRYSTMEKILDLCMAIAAIMATACLSLFTVALFYSVFKG